MANDKTIWEFLKSQGLNDYGAAGLMGNLYAESGLSPTNLQNTYNNKFGMTDDEYTAAVDAGRYGNFIHDSAGYGLAQWTFWSRKQGLYDYAKSTGKSIGDLTMQLEFLFQELSSGYKSVLSTLKSATSVLQASMLYCCNLSDQLIKVCLYRTKELLTARTIITNLRAQPRKEGMLG